MLKELHRLPRMQTKQNLKGMISVMAKLCYIVILCKEDHVKNLKFIGQTFFSYLNFVDPTSVLCLPSYLTEKIKA